MSYEKDLIAKKERRERIAVKCLQGLLSGSGHSMRHGKDEVVLRFEAEEAARLSIAYADAMIAELDK